MLMKYKMSSFDYHSVFASEAFQRLAGMLGIAIQQSSDPVILCELGQLFLQLQDEQADTSLIIQKISHLLLQLRDDHPALQYTATDYKWLCQQIEQQQWQTLLFLVGYAVVLAAQAQEPNAYFTPSDLAKLSGETEATWRQRLRHESHRFLAAKVGPGGTWIVPKAAARAYGL